MNVFHMLGFYMLEFHDVRMWSYLITCNHIVSQVWSNVDFCYGGAKFPAVTCDQNV